MNKKNMHVLLIEDDHLYVEIIRKVFDKFTILTTLTIVHNINEARSVILKSSPDVIVTESSLPDGKGLELICVDGKNFLYPIIVITDECDIKAAVDAVKAGAFDYIVKSEESLNELPNVCEKAVIEWDQIVEQKMVKNELQQRVRELNALNRFMQQVNSDLSLAQVVQIALKGIVPLVSPDLVMIFLRQGNDLVLQGLDRSDPKYNHEEKGLHRVGECLCGIAAENGKAAYSYDIHDDKRCTWNGCKMAGLRSFAAIPLLKDGNVIGVLGLAAGEKKRDFGKQSHFLEILSNGIAIGLQNAILYKEANESRDVLIKTNRMLKDEIGIRAETEKALKKANSLLKSTFSSIKELVVLVDPSTRSIISCNKAIKDIFGYKVEEVVGRNVEFLHLNRSMYDKFGKMLYAALDADRVFHARFKMKRKDGDIIFTEHTANKIKTETVLQYAIVSVIRDITEYKKAEDALLQSEKRFRAAATTSTDIIYEYDRDSEEIKWIGDNINAFGYTVYELPHTLKGYRELFHADDKENALMIYGNLFKTGENSSFVHRIRGKDGTYFYCEDRMTTVKYEKGVPKVFVGSITDITKRKRADDDMRYLRNLLKNVIDSMPSMLVTVDYDGKIMQWNREAEKQTGLSRGNASGCKLTDVFKQLSIRIEEVREVIRSQTPRKDEKLISKIDDETRFSDVTIYPLIANGVKGAVVRIDDVTERVRIEEMMVQSEKMLSVGGLAAGMAHEINNPLAGILQSSQVVLDRTMSDLPTNKKVASDCGTEFDIIKDYMDKREIVSMVEAIRLSGQRAAKIVSNMLNFSRKSDADFKPHDLGELLERTLELASNDYDLKKKYDFRQILIERQYEPGLPAVNCEETKIQQVILNLLKNGAQAMAEQNIREVRPKFIIRTSLDGDMVRIEVEDNGPGMNETTRKRAFEPFFSTKDVGVGTGLGLSVSYFIISENHGGSMTVESELGKGTKFVIRLPIL